MSPRGARWLALTALAALLVPTLLLVGGLPGTPFSDGRPFDEREPSRDLTSSGGGSVTPLRPLDLWMALAPLGALVVALVAYVVLQMRRSGVGGRRRSLFHLVALGVVMVALAFVARDKIIQSLQEGAVASEDPAVTAADGSSSVDRLEEAPEPLPEAAPPDARATSLLLQGFFAVVALAAAAAIAVTISRMRVRRPPAPPAPDAEELAAPIERALDRLRQGRDAAGVVEECYRDMMALLARTLDVEPRTLTPREFARAVRGLGVEGPAVDDLTELFELVRYGRRSEEPLAPRAVECLTRLRSQWVEPAPGAAR